MGKVANGGTKAVFLETVEIERLRESSSHAVEPEMLACPMKMIPRTIKTLGGTTQRLLGADLSPSRPSRSINLERVTRQPGDKGSYIQQRSWRDEMVTDEDLKALRRPAPSRMDEPATEKQVNYIAILVEDKEIPQNWMARLDEYAAQPFITKRKAGEIISALKQLPQKRGFPERTKNNPEISDVPSGRYAIRYDEDDENAVVFYRVGRSRDNPNAVRVYIVAGPNEHRQPHFKAKYILKAIYRAGIAQSAMLYGQKLRHCGKCGIQLTNRTSRERGLGPICSERMLGAEESKRVTKKIKENIIARGEDPDEEVSES
jgi:hypothetical protein